jgi:glycosyltransferase involved in cell wall biosynthesis
MNPDISIVIPARNEGRRIARCLCSLGNQSLVPERYEIIVVDDGSDDDSAQVAQLHGARVVRQQKKGAAAARNLGIAEARGEVILFTDADCIADEHWAERLANPLLEASIQGTVGRIITRQKHWLARLIQAELDERYSRMQQSRFIDFINSGNCGFKRALLDENRYDESFSWIEDLELSFRLARGGNRMIFVPDAIIAHEHPQNLWVYLRRKFRYASYASALYRRYPDKILSDSRTPAYVRWQLLLVALAALSAPLAIATIKFLLFGLICFAGAAAFSYPFYLRAIRTSPPLGIMAPFFALLGNLAFTAGTITGLLFGKNYQTRKDASNPSR